MPGYKPDTDYIVEISGWDSEGTFFVEWTILQWKRGKKKKLYLSHLCGVKAIVMVRSHLARLLPMLMRIVHVGSPDSLGSREVCAIEVKPRTRPRVNRTSSPWWNWHFSRGSQSLVL